jgi:putative membrane-bound dehydrogenase-like protein
MLRNPVCVSITVCAGVIVGALFDTTHSNGQKPTVNKKVTQADLPRIPPTEPRDALKTFQLAKGFKLELVAAEPLVGDPVDACFDENGRLYVAEMHGYPFSQEPTRLNPRGGGLKDAGIIRLLRDTNGDGRFDKSTVFAKGISWPVSVCCYNGGVFVLAPQSLYYFKDTNGDGKADVKEVILEGFGRGNVQAMANNLKWGLDNRIYFAAGRNPANLKHRGKPLFSARGRDVKFDPKTEKFELITGGQQFGLSMDDWGNRFVCSNSDHIQQVVYPQHYLARNPYLAVSRLIRSIATDGAAGRVYRISPPEPWRIIRQKWRAAAKGYKLVVEKDGSWKFIPLDPKKKPGGVPTEYPVGYFTSATGITIYRGNAYPPEFRGDAFVGDVGGNLVHRKIVKENGILFTASRADAGEEFIRSTDNWFRPVNFVNAPDGTLFVLDMYRETIEHPFSIPQEIKQFLHLTAGRNRGRIYRIVSPGMQRIHPLKLGPMTDEQLVKQLESDNAWNRETAQRLLWERQHKAVIPSLAALAANSKKPLARLHALYTLAGLHGLTPEVVHRALKDDNPHVREHAVRLTEPFLKKSDDLLVDLLPLCGDANDRVRFQVAFTLGESRSDQVIAGLARIARDPRNGREIRTALLSSVAGKADRLMIALIGDSTFIKQKHAQSLLSELGLILGADRNPKPALRVLSAVAGNGRSPAIQQAVLSSVGEGLSRRGSSVQKLLTDKRAAKELTGRIKRLFAAAAKTAFDAKQPLVDRAAAVGVLAFANYAAVKDRFAELLSPQSPAALQRAAVAALSQHDHPETAKLIIAHWRQFSPQVRNEAVDALTSSIPRTRLLLAAIESKQIGRGDLTRDKKQLLMNHRNRGIRARSRRIFAGELNTNRAKVVAAYQSALSLDGDVRRGLAVFKKNCAACHQVGNIGHNVAPPLASVSNKSEADLLIAILDPSREAQPNFNVYTVVSLQGKIYTGIIVAETANSITLRRAEAKQDVILRSNIDVMKSSGKSLMPDGLEKDLKPQDIADVIAFIKTIKPAKRKR